MIVAFLKISIHATQSRLLTLSKKEKQKQVLMLIYASHRTSRRVLAKEQNIVPTRRRSSDIEIEENKVRNG